MRGPKGLPLTTVWRSAFRFGTLELRLRLRSRRPPLQAPFLTSPLLATGRNTAGEAEAQEVVAGGRYIPAAGRYTAIPGAAVPAASAFEYPCGNASWEGRTADLRWANLVH